MDDFENDIYGGVTTDDITGAVNDPNYDSNWSPNAGGAGGGTGATGQAGGTTTSPANSGSGNATGSDRALAVLGFGIASLASALRNLPPAVKMPVYREAPVYNRALTAPMLPPQPAPQKSASGQNIYQPMVGLPLFFNPNPFQFNPTEAAKRYGPTQEEIMAGQQGYSQGLERLYQTLGAQPNIQFASNAAAASANPAATGSNTVNGATGGSMDDLMMAAGRYLKGPGDGMSDDIHAFIDGGSTGEHQPARLARNEFVIPADVVSDLGNGSSDAGAEALYEMIERVRKARHGTEKQPPAVKPSKVMPS